MENHKTFNVSEPLFVENMERWAMDGWMDLDVIPATPISLVSSLERPAHLYVTPSHTCEGRQPVPPLLGCLVTVNLGGWGIRKSRA